MKALLKSIAILLGLIFIMQPSIANAQSDILNASEKVSLYLSDESTNTTSINSTAYSDDIEKIDLSLTEKTTYVAAKYNIDSLKEKINNILLKVEKDQESGIEFAKENLGEEYLDASNKEDNLDALNIAINGANELIDYGTADETTINNAYKSIDRIYSQLRTIEKYYSFSGTDGDVWKDTNGVPIQAHGGQVQWSEKEGKWYWYGEDKTKGYRSNGISAYSSDDLYNWNFEGYVMRTISNRQQLDDDPYFSDLYGDYTSKEKDNIYVCINNSTAVIERPKVIYNKKTGKYVLWFHADGPTEAAPNSNYAAAAAGVAISDSPNGPFKFINRYRLDVCPEEDKVGAWYESSVGFARDMNLWIDDDETAYIIYSSEENRTMFISRLNRDYTKLNVDPKESVKGKDFVRLFPGAQREAPALFKYDNKYYMITSGATGWDPNQAEYWVADNILGEWTRMGDPCIGDTNKKTFYTQSTNVINVDKSSGKFIYMGDRWKSSNLADSRYVWLPIEFGLNGKLIIKSYKDWSLDDLTNKYSIKINDKIKDIYTSTKELPNKLNISVQENGQWISKDTSVTWNIPDIKPLDQGIVTGTLNEINREIKVDVANIPSNLIYFIDSGSKNKSTLYNLINENTNLINNERADKPYESGSWGYLGNMGTDIGYKNPDSTDAYTSGLWAYKNKNIEYILPLKKGNYNLYAGFDEWWNTNRTMGILLSYKNENNEDIKQEFGIFSNNGRQKVGYSIYIPVDTEVKINVYKPETKYPDVVLSWLGIQQVKE